jgi:hypothetical protein
MKSERTFILTVRSKSSAGYSSRFPMAMNTPALLTTTSSLPNCAMAVSTQALAFASSAMSPLNATAERPWARMAATTSSTGSSARPQTTTEAPSFANLCAMASPMPVAAPVMMATLPASRPLPAWGFITSSPID